MTSRTWPLAAVVVLALALVGCGAAATPSPTALPTAAPSDSRAPSPTTAGRATPVALPPAETAALNIGLSNGLAIEMFHNALARDLGLFQKYGLNVTVTSLQGASAVVQGLVSGALQVGDLSAGSAISAALTDSPLVVASVDSTALDYVLIGGKAIKSAADLKGKAIGLNSFGGITHVAVLAALAKLDLKASDVLLQVVGAESARTAAVVSGAVAAVAQPAARTASLVDLGLNVLVDLTKTPIRVALSGLTVTKAWAAKNPNTMLRILAAQLEAQKVMFTKAPLAIAAYMSYAQVGQVAANSSMDSCAAGFCNKGFRFTKDDFTVNKDVLVTISPAASSVDVASIVDLSYLDKLQQLGFIAELQFP